MRHAVLLFVLSLAAAQADILHLHNGRTLEGQIVRRTPSKITLRMNHGRMEVRTDQVKEIERRLRPELELAERYREIDPTNPAQLERLSLWASRRGLGQEASDLIAHARGIRLEHKLDAIRDSRRVQDWIDVYSWARVNEVSETVQSFLLETAQGIDPDDRGLQAVFAAREEEARAASRRQADIERRRNQPIFKMPDEDRRLILARGNTLIPVVDERNRKASQDRVRRIAGGGGLRPAAKADAKTDARIEELEQRLEAQEQRAVEQDERASEQEAELRQLRRRRAVRRSRNPNGPQLLRAKPLPAEPAPPPTPRAKPTVFR